jgi:hypothetical protein
MDIYRFFHPHHNPRLHSTPLRQQELGELEQAASELLKSLERAQKRTARKAPGAILPQHFNDILKAMRFVLSSLETLCDAHPGDSPEALYELIQERSELTGWETWTSLLHEQLSAKQFDEGRSPESDGMFETFGGPQHRVSLDTKSSLLSEAQATDFPESEELERPLVANQRY